ncbi:MAG: ATP-binding protein, partial [Desulfovibrionales bacterium]
MKNMKTFQKLLLAFGGMLVLFFILLVICYSGFKTMISARNSVLHANQVSDSLNEIHLELLRGRADFRDLIIDEIEPSTEPVRAGFASIQVKLDAFEELTADNPDHQAAIEILQRQYRDWLHALSPVFSRPAGELMSEQELRTFILSDPGEELFESMRATLERIHRNEENLLKQHSGEMQKLESYTGIILGGGGVLIILLGGFLSSVVALSITRPLSQITAYARRIARGEYGFPLEIDQRDEIGALARELRTFQKSMVEKTRVTEAIASGDLTPSVRLAGENDTLGNSINRMTAALRQAREQTEITDWGKSGLNELAARAQGETDAKHLANKVLSFLAPYLNAQIATLYLLDEDGRLVLRGGYAVEPEQLEEKRIKPGQGLVGQAASEQRIISVPSVPENYLHISSSVGAAPPKNLVALPFVHQGKLIGVMEIGSFETFAEYVIDFLQTAAESLAVAFDSINHQTRMKNLLEQTRNQAQQLQEQQEELQTANEELEEHSQTLQQSEDELKQQREELQVVNEELEEKNEALEKQKTLIQEKNRDLDRTWKDLKRKAAELEESSRYKSEFLANMSHELRTPLNSLLLLSRSLKENTSGALSEDDIEAAGIIYKNGTDLLNLINDILDLSKIEAGKLNIKLHPVRPAEVGGSILMDFKHLAEEKGISLDFSMEDDLPSSIHTDRQRLEQILRNLVSNAVKFTQKGGVKLRVFQPNGSAGLKDFDPSATVAFEVKDTGIGIPTEKQHAIFEAFQQADGGTSRRFGGTGLGLTIARQLAHLLGGEVTL